MSTLRVSTVANQAGTGSPDIVGGELSRCRINFDGTGSITIRDAYNVSSIIDNGVGDYTLNFNVAAPNSNYSVVGVAIRLTVVNGVLSLPMSSAGQQATANIRFACVQPGVSAFDGDFIQMIFVGDKP